jgi:GntR family transcriptional regulator
VTGRQVGELWSRGVDRRHPETVQETPIDFPSVSRYRQLAQHLREAIRRGDHAPGSTLPSEAQLVATYSLSRPTVRRALALLRAEGLIDVQAGRGAFVVAQPPIRLTLNRYRPAAQRPDVGPFEATVPGGFGELVMVQVEVADDDVAARLEIESGDEVVYRRRHMHADPDASVVQIQEGRFPLAVVEGTLLAERAKVTQGTYAALASIGHPPTTITEEVAARMPSADEAALLALGPGEPVLTVTRLTRDQDARPVELLRVVASADRTVLCYEDLAVNWPGA